MIHGPQNDHNFNLPSIFVCLCHSIFEMVNILFRFEIDKSTVLNTLTIAVFLNFLSHSGAEPLKYEHAESLILLNHSFYTVILPLLTSASVPCIFSENEEFLVVSTKVLKWFKTLIFDNFTQQNFKLCNSIVLLGFDHLNFPNIFFNLSTPAIFISNSTLTKNIPDIENYLRSVSSPEVVILSLYDDSVFELSPVFPQPRHLRSSSIQEVLKHRVQPTKMDLGGSVLPVATGEYIPFFLIKDQEKGEFDGIEWELMSEISRHLNFSPDYLLYNSWGTLMPNGTWVGAMVGAVQEGKAELVIANLWQATFMYSAMDFGPSINRNQMGFLVRRPELVHFKWSSVLTIFKPWVWFATILCFVLVVIVYWAGVNWDLHSHSESWAGSVVTVVGHLTMSTSHRRVRDGNTRYTLTSWSVFSLLFTTCLSTGIVTRLTLPHYTARLDTIRQLLESGHYWTIDYYKNSSQNQLLREFMFDFENPWVAAFENTYIYLEPEEILKIVETDSKITFIGEKYGKNIMVYIPIPSENKAYKKFRFCKETTRETYVSIGIKKKSPLFEALSVLILKIFEIGLLDHWEREVLRRWPQYDTSLITVERDVPTLGEPEELTFSKVRPVFYVLWFGLGIASLVFVVEIIL